MTRLFSHEAADLEPCLEAAERETALGLKDLVGAKDVWQTCGRLFPVAKTSPPCGKGVARGSGRVARVCVWNFHYSKESKKKDTSARACELLGVLFSRSVRARMPQSARHAFGWTCSMTACPAEKASRMPCVLQEEPMIEGLKSISTWVVC